MIPEFGYYALILALCLAVIQSIVPLLGILLKRPFGLEFAQPAALGQVCFVSMSFAILVYCFIRNDFSVAYIAQHSNSALPLLYRIAAVWGAHEGSLLLWVTLLGMWTAAVCLFSKSLPLQTRSCVIAILGLISTGFLLFILTASSPFRRLLPNPPDNGLDLNPLLQDPGLAIHPPMLYMGYVGFAVAFAFALTALINGRLDSAWARWTRPWTLIAWCFLTFGITLGSWWAYRVLGWGGWWFWDPVENASFLPWLTGTALVHSLAVTEKRGLFKSWTVLLAICAFSLSLLGTFLVRSGVLVSVHAFASDPARGAFMLKFLFLVIGGSLLLYAWRAPNLHGTAEFKLFSREAMILLNNVILLVAMLTVLLGTLYPLIFDALALGKISVGPPYFNRVFIPLMAVLLFCMGIVPHSRWRHTAVDLFAKRLSYIIVLSVGIGIIIVCVINKPNKIYILLGMSLSCWIIFSTLQDILRRARQRGNLFLGLAQLSRSQYGMLLAHVGVAVSVIGITLTSNCSLERDVKIAPGETIAVGAYQFKFLGIRELKGPNYTGASGGFLASKDGQAITVLDAQKRIYTVSKTAMTEAAIDANLFRDLYVALGEPLDNGAWSARVYYKPFIRWVWLGGLLMLGGGLLAASNTFRTRAKIAKD